jgi:hypothetical protein
VGAQLPVVVLRPRLGRRHLSGIDFFLNLSFDQKFVVHLFIVKFRTKFHPKATDIISLSYYCGQYIILALMQVLKP